VRGGSSGGGVQAVAGRLASAPPASGTGALRAAGDCADELAAALESLLGLRRVRPSRDDVATVVAIAADTAPPGDRAWAFSPVPAY
jgi:hypothetical protein